MWNAELPRKAQKPQNLRVEDRISGEGGLTVGRCEGKEMSDKERSILNHQSFSSPFNLLVWLFADISGFALPSARGGDGFIPGSAPAGRPDAADSFTEPA